MAAIVAMAALAEARPRSDVGTRVLSAAVLTPAALAAIWYGHPWWTGFVVFFGTVMAWEWAQICGHAAGAWRGESFIAAALALICLLLFGFQPFGIDLPVWATVIIAACLATLAAFPRHRGASPWFGAGMIYVLGPCLAILWLRNGSGQSETDRIWEMAWVLSLVIAADTGAYLVGRAVGGPKLAPSISPSKTWAGLGGAMLGAALAGAIVAIWLGLDRAWPLAVFSAGLAVIEQAGDLAESRFKRGFGVKDSGRIIPGHGGALDRVDGLMAVALVVALLDYLLGDVVLKWL